MNQISPQRQDPQMALIHRLEIEDLFYTYSYDLTPAKTAGPESGKLLLLYGNNGTGKTTILNLIYHLFNPEPYGGHRSYVGKIPFRAIRIHLSNGMILSAQRTESSDPGNYNVVVSDSEENRLVDWTWQKDKKSPTQEEEHKYQLFCNTLLGLRLTFHYLRDTRRIEGSVNSRRKILEKRFRHSIEGNVVLMEEEDEELFSPERELKQSIERAVQWFQQQALSGTNVGYTSVNSLYRDIIKRIVTYGPTTETSEEDVIGKLKDTLLRLQTRNRQFAKYGLTPELEIDDIIVSLSAASLQHSDILKTVLGPYLEGHQARLNALQDLQKVMHNFVSLLADFYSHKQVTVHLEKGLQISSDKGHSLSPTALSSGEKQLLLLLCHAISARREGTIFVIDEPEISLNVKWQRQLIPALLTCLSGTQFQIILATHSVELLSRYREYVTPLDNLAEGDDRD